MTVRQGRTLILLASATYLIGLWVLSGVRPIDGDEGYYASATRLVSEGQTPYLDFFYPQMPVVPYLYAPVYALTGHSLRGLRLGSVLCGGLALLLFGAWLRRAWPGARGTILAGLLLVAINPYLLSWGVTVKTYAAANLGVVAVFWTLQRAWVTRRTIWFLAAGIAAGLTVSTRLLYLPWAAVVVVLPLVMLLRTGERERIGPTLWASASGVVVGLLPAIVLFVVDADRFLFDNLRYHQLRFSPEHRAGVGAAFEVLSRALFLNPFMAFQLGLAACGVWWLRVHRRSPARTVVMLSLVGAVVHTATCLVPDPVYEQYFLAPLSAMLAPLTIAGIVQLGNLARGRSIVPAAALVLGLALAIVDLKFRHTGMRDAEVWTFDHLERVTRSIQQHSRPDDVVLAFWSGYVFESGRRYLPGMENHFAIGVSERLTPEENLHFRVAGKESIYRALHVRRPAVLVLGAWMYEINTTIDQRDLPAIVDEMNRQYGLAEAFGETKVLVPRPTAPR